MTAQGAPVDGPATPPDNGEPPLPTRLGPLEKAVAVALLIGMAAFVVALVYLRGDPAWDRLVFLFSGYEAIVFAAAGALFGTRIQRGMVQLAQRNADAATDQAQAAQQQVIAERTQTEQARADSAAAYEQTRQAEASAQHHAVQAQAGRSLAAAIQGELTPGVVGLDAGRRGARDAVEATAAADPAMLRMAAMAKVLFPDV